MNEPAETALQPHQARWLQMLDAYASAYPREEEAVAQFRAFMQAHADAAERTRIAGHLTGSAWLVSRDGKRALLTHHRKLDRWLQPGGHADGDTDLARVALREAEEESGIAHLALEGAIFDIDRHEIAAYIPVVSPDGPFAPGERSPTRASEPAHWHYDVRFVVRATAGEAFVVGDESHALAWREIAMLADDAGFDASLRRMARKWLARTPPA